MNRSIKADHAKVQDWRAAVIGSAIAFTMAGLLYALMAKGMWYDEVWTLFMASPDRPLGQTYAERWIFDIHPPFYYAWSRIAETVNAHDIRGVRLLNIVPAAALLGYAWFLGKRVRELWGTVGLAVILFLTNPLVFDVFIQARSYFTFLCAWLVVWLGTLYASARPGDLGRGDRGVFAGMAAGILLSLTLHYYCAVLAAVMIGVQALALWLGGKRRWALAVLAVAFLSGLVVIASALNQLSTLREIGGNFWARTSLVQAIVIEAQAVVFALGLNIVALIAFAATLIRSGATPVRRFVWVSLASIVLALVITLAFNAVRPMLVRQYLLPIMAPAAVAVAATVAPSAWRNRWVFVALVVNAALLVAVSTWRRSHVQDMNALAAWIGGQVAACPATRVVAMAPWDFTGQRAYLMVNERTVSALGYRALGTRYGFAVATPADAVAAAGCPLIVWTERVGGPAPDVATIIRRARLRIAPSDVASVRDVRSESGIAIVLDTRPRS